MARTPEGKVKDEVVKILKKYGVYYVFYFSSGYSKSGPPDLLCCFNGRFIGIECKAGTNTMTALQRVNSEQIRTAGGVFLCVNESNVGEVERVIKELVNETAQITAA